MTSVLSRAVVQWMVENSGQRPDVRDLKHRSVDPGEHVEVWSDPPGMFDPDMIVVARAAEDFVVSRVCSSRFGVVIVVANVSRSSMPRRFDGWLVGRDASHMRSDR